MPSTPTQLYRGNAATSLTTLFTNTSGKTTVVSSIAIVNSSATARTVNLNIGGTQFLVGVSVDPNATYLIDNARQVLTATQNIQGSASTTDIRFHISGTVID